MLQRAHCPSWRLQFLHQHRSLAVHPKHLWDVNMDALVVAAALAGLLALAVAMAVAKMVVLAPVDQIVMELA